MSDVAIAATLAPSARRRLRGKFMILSPQGRNKADLTSLGELGLDGKPKQMSCNQNIG
jgi:hypothetical protein